MSPVARGAEDTISPLTNHSTMASVLSEVNEQVSVTDVPSWTGVSGAEESCIMVGAAGTLRTLLVNS